MISRCELKFITNFKPYINYRDSLAVLLLLLLLFSNSLLDLISFEAKDNDLPSSKLNTSPIWLFFEAPQLLTQSSRSYLLQS